MATLLVNHRMNPALARRIEASVTGRHQHRTGRDSMARLRSLVHLGVVLSVLALIVAIFVSVRRENAELRQARADLFTQWAAQSAPLSPKDKAFVTRVERVLTSLKGQYPLDVIADELLYAGALDTLLARPAVYVRGPLSEFSDSAAIARVASESGKDTLLLCLLEPPSSRDEKALLAKARLTIIGGSPVQSVTSSALRLHDAEAGLPFLMPAWGERINNAKDQFAISQLEAQLRHAPVSSAKRILRSEILIAVFDEPNVKGRVTELDGEGRHAVRLTITQLEPEKTLLSLRRTVDPSWITANRRSQYSHELDSCKFALEVRDTVLSPSPKPDPALLPTP